jgi:hypothetical protein
MRRFAVLGSTLILAGFAPPEPTPLPESSQQQPMPKGWVPQTKHDQAPPITLEAIPRQHSAYSHAYDLECTDVPGQPSARAFVEAYQGALSAIQDVRFNDAVRFAEIAAQNANGFREWLAVENLRALAFIGLKNDVELVATLEALLSSKDCMTAAQETNFHNLLGEARSRMAMPR